MFADPPLTAARPEAPHGEWRGVDLVVGVALLVASIVVLGVILAVYAKVSGAALETGGVAATATLLFELGLGGIVALLAWRRGLGPRDLGFVRPRRWAPLGLAWAGVYASLIAYQLALALLRELGVDTGGLGEGNVPPIEEDTSRLALVVLGASIVVGAPVGEELFFRALLYRGLRRLWGVLPGMAASAALFAGFHLDLSVLAPFLLVGALLAWSYQASGSIWVPIGVHALFNGAAFTLELLFRGGA